MRTIPYEDFTHATVNGRHRQHHWHLLGVGEPARIELKSEGAGHRVRSAGISYARSRGLKFTSSLKAPYKFIEVRLDQP